MRRNRQRCREERQGGEIDEERQEGEMRDSEGRLKENESKRERVHKEG